MLHFTEIRRRSPGAVTVLGLLIGCLLISKPASVSAQTGTDDSPKRAVMKIEESSHTLTPENGEARQVIVSKVYDTEDSLGNSYLVRLKDGKKAVVIDPGYNYEAIAKYLERIDVDLEAILLTNGYFLRIAGNGELRRQWPDTKIIIGEKDAGLLSDPKANMSDEFGGVTSPVADVRLSDGETFEVAGIPFSAMATPGHTPGSMTYMIPTDEHPIAFTGDFIYKDGISSASLPSSDEEDLQKSLDRFLTTQYAETLVFPGYGADTSVSEFYRQLTGRSISVLDDESGDDSPIIIVERDPGTVVVTEPVYVPTITYHTETIVVEPYVRPWLAVGVSIPLWSHWYRPWHSYHYHHPLPPPIHRPPYHGGHRPPPIVPPRPGRPDMQPGQGPNRPGMGAGPNRPGAGRPDMQPGQGPNRPGMGAGPNRPGAGRPDMQPGQGPNRPGMGAGPNRPGAGRPDMQPGQGPNRPGFGTRPGGETRPQPGTSGGNRTTPSTRPGTSAPFLPPRTSPGASGGNRMTPSTRSTTSPTTRSAIPSAATNPRPTTANPGGNRMTTAPRAAARTTGGGGNARSNAPTARTGGGGNTRNNAPAARGGGNRGGGPRGFGGERD